MNYLHYDIIDSTNEEAKRLIAAGDLSSNTIITADEQTAGKGTQGRVWKSPKNAGLYVSFVHLDSLALTPLYTQAAGIACAQTIEECFGKKIQLKPVNDLYAVCPETDQLKKLGGILTESLVQENQLRALITGIGINLQPVNLPPNPAGYLAIGLKEILSPQQFAAWNRDEFIHVLLEKLESLYQFVHLNKVDELDKYTHQYAFTSQLI